MDRSLLKLLPRDACPSCPLNVYEQSSTRVSHANPLIKDDVYRSFSNFDSYQPVDYSVLPTASRFNSAIQLLTSPEHESKTSHESVDHAFDEFAEEELAKQIAW